MNFGGRIAAWTHKPSEVCTLEVQGMKADQNAVTTLLALWASKR